MSTLLLCGDSIVFVRHLCKVGASDGPEKVIAAVPLRGKYLAIVRISAILGFTSTLFVGG